MTCHSTSRPRSRISGISVHSTSDTPPPKAVALSWTTRLPFSGSASSRISSTSGRPTMWVESARLLPASATGWSTAGNLPGDVPERALAQPHLDLARVAVAMDLERDLFARLEVGDQVRELSGA